MLYYVRPRVTIPALKYEVLYTCDTVYAASNS